jgi:hypothetical protein
MQTLTWTGFIDRLAAAVGVGVRDVVHADKREVEEREEDRCAEGMEPTFRAMDPAMGTGRAGGHGRMAGG